MSAASTGRVQVAFSWNDDGSPRGTLYTYDAREMVSVGDIVVVPPNWFSSTPQAAIVAVLGSDYTGPVSRITRVMQRARS